METQIIQIRGKVIEPSRIMRIWEDIRQELINEGYSVAKVTDMPKIRGVTVTTKWLKRMWQITSSSPHLLNTSQLEWGEKKEGWKVCTFFADVKQEWIVVVWERVKSIEYEVRHELLHIWESLLLLQRGTLTKKFG